MLEHLSRNHGMTDVNPASQGTSSIVELVEDPKQHQMPDDLENMGSSQADVSLEWQWFAQLSRYCHVRKRASKFGNQFWGEADETRMWWLRFFSHYLYFELEVFQVQLLLIIFHRWLIADITLNSCCSWFEYGVRFLKDQKLTRTSAQSNLNNWIRKIFQHWQANNWNPSPALLIRLQAIWRFPVWWMKTWLSCSDDGCCKGACIPPNWNWDEPENPPSPPAPPLEVEHLQESQNDGRQSCFKGHHLLLNLLKTHDPKQHQMPVPDDLENMGSSPADVSLEWQWFA